jgi:para-aminobenzoate synthetase component 1
MKYSNFCFLENNHYQFDHSIEAIAGLGCLRSLDSKGDLSDISTFQIQNRDWIFGHVAYDLKNKIEHLSSNHFDGINFPDYFFFVPDIVIIFRGDKVSIGVINSPDAAKIFTQINVYESGDISVEKSALIPRFTPEEYLNAVASIQKHIAKGDCYEVCFCVEYFRENCPINPVETFLQLNKLSPNPFASFYKMGDKYLLCASPERFLKKQKSNLISQPIKGTLKRSGKDALSDKEEKKRLLHDEKERAENIMIVDLVRNDLSRVCRKGSVKVRNFLEIHTFPQVHQMISTISGEVEEECTFGELLPATFPMGSMTGAPKIKAMELIEKFEKTRRGLFSGSVGYISPVGDFDFNVVIRSILYNETSNYLSVQVGSAITSKSDAKKEYAECNAKIEALIKTLK